jgi:oligopeptide/dipeptide ABC transporter ATP-binding protein
MAMVFQEPMTSLNPVLRIGEQLSEPLQLHRGMDRKTAAIEAAHLLHQVGISDPGLRLRDYPHQLSGGQRQRVMIAMALACNPALLIADEPTTALDVTTQAQILALMDQLKAELGSSVMFVTHDLGIVAQTCQDVAVMYLGRVVEYSPVEALFDTPLHPYTKGLMRSVPVLGKVQSRLNAIRGNVPAFKDIPSGCSFRDRCDEAFERCVETPPVFYPEPGRRVRCWRYAHG